jgi:tetratricopeptide (TPR) repeat protein
MINLGIAYKSLRRYDDALRTYAKVNRIVLVPAAAHRVTRLLQVLQSDGNDWKALYNSGNCYYEMGQWAHSVDMYKLALKIKPHHPDASNNM